jgi:hypothetical protein
LTTDDETTDADAPRDDARDDFASLPWAHEPPG